MNISESIAEEMLNYASEKLIIRVFIKYSSLAV